MPGRPPGVAAALRGARFHRCTQLAEVRTAVLAPEWGEESHPVAECLRGAADEHVEHRRFALRDLAVLQER